MRHLSGVTSFLMISLVPTLHVTKGYGVSSPSIPDDFVDVQADLDAIREQKSIEEEQKQIEDGQYRAETSAIMQHVKKLQEEMEKIPSLSEIAQPSGLQYQQYLKKLLEYIPRLEVRLDGSKQHYLDGLKLYVVQCYEIMSYYEDNRELAPLAIFDITKKRYPNLEAKYQELCVNTKTDDVIQ